MSKPWEMTALANGLRVVTQPVPTAQSAAVSIFAGVGSRAEERRVNGVSHYLEHMLFKGTLSRPSAAIISETIEGAGGTLNAYTSRELTCYWNLVPYDRFETGMDIACDIYLHALLDPEEIERERNVVQQEIKRSKDQPASWTAELITRAVFGDQPIGWPIAGTEESVGGITREDQARHIETWYTPGNSVVSVAGNVTHEQVLEPVMRAFGSLPSRPMPPVPPAQTAFSPERIRIDRRETSQCNIQIGLYGIPWKDAERYPLAVLTTLLGRGMSSRLFKEVRERRGLAYSVGAGHQRYRDCGLFTVSAGVNPEQVLETVRVTMGELAKLCSDAVEEDELERARDYTAGSFRLGLETPMAMAQRNGDSLVMGDEIEDVEDVVARIQAVTPADLLRVARRIFRDDNLAIAVVGPAPSEDELASALRVG